MKGSEMRKTDLHRWWIALTKINIRYGWAPIGLSFTLVAALFLVQGHIGINLADEGYLWYGALRTGLGDIPIRDFNSYDPGRYYWAAFWMKILGTGLISFRMTVAIFQFLGLSCGLLALSHVVKSRLLLMAAGFVFLLWMFPRHKLFEPSIAMILIYFGVLLFEKPSLSRHFIAGIIVGLAAFFGRNHGLYAFIGFLLIMLFIWFKLSRNDLRKRLLAWGAGIALGYSPMLAMLLFVPGFAKSFWESITFLFALSSTNLPLPIPWPWHIHLSQGNSLEIIRQALVGLFFLAMPFYYLGAIVYCLAADRQALKQHSLFVASSFIGIGYMHYAFSRADIAHLAQGIHPLLLSCIAFPLTMGKRQDFVRIGIVLVLLSASLFSVGTISPYYQWVSRRAGSFEMINIGRDKVLADSGTAGIIRAAEKINRDFINKDEQLLIAPHWPMLYAILNRKSPLWETYFLFSRSPETQMEMIRQLEAQHTNWVILGDVPLDNRDELRFRNTHHLVWEYLNQEFRPVDFGGLPANYKLLKRIYSLK